MVCYKNKGLEQILDQTRYSGLPAGVKPTPLRLANVGRGMNKKSSCGESIAIVLGQRVGPAWSAGS